MTLPLAIYLTRFSDSYDLLHSGFAVPVAGALGLLAQGLARGWRRRNVLGRPDQRGRRTAAAGRALGAIGIGLALAGVVALGVFWLLEYVGSRE